MYVNENISARRRSRNMQQMKTIEFIMICEARPPEAIKTDGYELMSCRNICCVDVWKKNEELVSASRG